LQCSRHFITISVFDHLPCYIIISILDSEFRKSMIKGYSGLAALDQHEALIRQALQAPPAELIAPSRSEEKVTSSE